ncbi:UAP56-interacting factor-like isoform X2 [Sceloporus undulatus]|uniref:UAP56-interacting factor-like isoform X2 n=1 Tax=Sceloporus undulatus TaxID=8520 RepID=UPI001C4C9E65|nr:UAP56-interacting factor-like isoform X2 [Sceloporus undulatus]
MEAPGAGPPEPGSVPASAPEAGSGPLLAKEEIDLSLDDIIKRNKKGQGNPKGNRWRQPLKNRNPAYGNGKPRFRSWVPRNVQGPNRFPGRFRKQPFYRKPGWNGVTRPGQGSPLGPNGTSPLNRTLSLQQDKQEETTMDTSGSGNGGATGGTQQRPPARTQRFRNARALPPAQRIPFLPCSNRPFWKNPRPPFFQRQSRFNFRGRQAQPRTEGKPPRIRRWQPQPSSGAVLTVSVSNPQASQTNMPGGKRPFPRERSAPAKMARHQPKGVPLRFNFRATANQTSLTLNERFSGLRNKRYFSAVRNPGRMVTLP